MTDSVTDPLPDLGRGDLPVTTFSEWRVSDPGRRDAAMHAAVDAWRDHDWPDGLVTHAVLASDDGTALHHVAQWARADAVGETNASSGRRFASIQAAAATTIERVGIAACRPVGTFRPPARDGVGLGTAMVAIEWRDRDAGPGDIGEVLDTLRHDHPEGLVAAYLFASTADRHLVAVSEWAPGAAEDSVLLTARGAGRTGSIRVSHHHGWRTAASVPTVPQE